MDIGEWSQESAAFKTITSESQTRNQTSNKKQPSKPRSKKRVKQSQKSKNNSFNGHSNSFVFANCSLQDLEYNVQQYKNLRLQLVEHQKYNKLVQVNRIIVELQNQIQKRRAKLLQQQKQQQQFELYQSHEQQMRYFKELWKQIFQKLSNKQRSLKEQLQEQHALQIQQRIAYLSKKQEELKKRQKLNRQLQQLKRLEQNLIKKNKWEDILKLDIGKKKKEIKNRLKEERKQMMSKLQVIQQQKLRSKYNKRASSFRMKMDQCRDYEYKIYKKNQEKLKKKFLISLNRLQQSTQIKARCMSANK